MLFFSFVHLGVSPPNTKKLATLVVLILLWLNYMHIRGGHVGFESTKYHGDIN